MTTDVTVKQRIKRKHDTKHYISLAVLTESDNNNKLCLIIETSAISLHVYPTILTLS